jgi:hypothetical protein
MTISSVSSTGAYGGDLASTQPKQPVQSSQSTPQDSVELSAKAKASLDVDHDGDSH